MQIKQLFEETGMLVRVVIRSDASAAIQNAHKLGPGRNGDGSFRQGSDPRTAPDGAEGGQPRQQGGRLHEVYAAAEPLAAREDVRAGQAAGQRPQYGEDGQGGRMDGRGRRRQAARR
eukprot:12991168-Alexandrium_andersonii.AAC.1